MELYIQGVGKVSLGRGDFVGQGGEAAVYARGDLAYKVYHDPARMVPPAKVRELAALTHSAIVRPQAVLLDGKNRPVGYTMRRVRDAYVLCQLFNRAFRDRHALGPDAILALVRKLQAGVRHVHQHGILIVDLNEMNFLVAPTFDEVLFIDVDSYQTPGFPATALMETVRDRHATIFSESTDWFAFGIVSFQLFAGIHPYKGKHPTLVDLDARMRANMSVLNPEVAVPQASYPFHIIPQAYRDWYRALFEDGKRLPPPQDAVAVLTLTPHVTRLTGSDRVVLRELYRFGAEVLYPLPTVSGPPAAMTVDGLYVGARRHAVPASARFAVTPRLGHLVAAWIEGRDLRFYYVRQGQPLNTCLQGEQLTTSGERLYVKNGDGLYEVEFVELPAGIQCALKPVANALPYATRLFEGVAMQDLLGAWYAFLFPRAGCCYPQRLPELDGYRIVEARYENQVLMVIGSRDGQYDQFIFRFDPAFRTHDARVIPDVPYTGLNFVTLDNGTCVHLNADEELELFSHRKDSPDVRTVADAAVQGARLFRQGAEVLVCRGDAVYAMSLHP